jgi:glycosyltransferase involved in cell wall biosynthesis
MHILFLSNWFPYPPNNGSKLRIYNLLKGISRSHEVTLVSFADTSVSSPSLDELQSICKRVYAIPKKIYDPSTPRSRLGFLSSTPRSISDTFSPEMAHFIQDLQESDSFDLVIASQVGTARYSCYFKNKPSIFEEVEIKVLYENFAHANSIYQWFRQGLTWFKHRSYLSRLMKDFTVCTVVSEQERQLVSRISPDYESIEVIPNCIDLAKYDDVRETPKPYSLIFTGSFRYHPNYDAMVWFLEEIYPLVQARISDVHLTITGDHANLPLPLSKNLILTGFIDDVRPLIASAWISLAPLRIGGGTRLKILEAMALKTPVVATSKGAEGLDVTHDFNILIADTTQEFADAIVRLLQESGLRQRLVENAYHLVLQKYNWSFMMPRFLEVIQKTVEV